MGYSVVDLKDRIIEMYPEIEAHGIVVNAVFDEELNAYVVRFRKGSHMLSTHLEKKDADDCIDGVRCVHLGVQIGQFLENFEAQSPAGSESRKEAERPVSLSVDDKGYLVNFNDWSEATAAALAEREGVRRLSKEQVELLRFIREYYLRHNFFPIVSALCRSAHQGRSCMREGFMTPLQAWKIAGLPQPDAMMLNLLEHNEPPT